MKKSAAIGIGVGVALLIVFAIVFFPTREPISLTLLQYYPLTPGAKLKLTNGSRKTITYLTDNTGAPVLSLLKTPTGWTNTSPLIIIGTWTGTSYGTSGSILTSKTNQGYVAVDPAKFPTSGGFRGFLQTYTLQPGESTELYVSLEAERSPIRVGTVCIVPQGKLARHFSKWINQGKTWLRIRAKPPDQIEVWCNKPLQVSSSPTREERP
jgi:hypothetical protein